MLTSRAVYMLTTDGPARATASANVRRGVGCAATSSGIEAAGVRWAAGRSPSHLGLTSNTKAAMPSPMSTHFNRKRTVSLSVVTMPIDSAARFGGGLRAEGLRFKAPQLLCV